MDLNIVASKVTCYGVGPSMTPGRTSGCDQLEDRTNQLPRDARLCKSVCELRALKLGPFEHDIGEQRKHPLRVIEMELAPSVRCTTTSCFVTIFKYITNGLSFPLTNLSMSLESGRVSEVKTALLVKAGGIGAAVFTNRRSQVWMLARNIYFTRESEKQELCSRIQIRS
ncbi:hypothetical protein DL95DRAFT_135345 [Leptodontidium sp. 2 PMI_412]|nr:hypothetical protein DL95DRAFT_135345 [Leptodontidium sp. 2 PMI_412]